MPKIVTNGNTASIHFETRKGTSISNTQSLNISMFTRSQFPNIERKYPKAQPRSEPSGYFNCHGLVFAARRAEIINASEVQKILKEDEYIEIKSRDVMPGDVILYHTSDGDIEHSGIVVTSPEPPLFVPLVISKWGAWREVMHYANDCAYDFSATKYYRIVK